MPSPDSYHGEAPAAFVELWPECVRNACGTHRVLSRRYRQHQVAALREQMKDELARAQ